MNKSFTALLAVLVIGLVGLFIASGGKQEIVEKTIENPDTFASQDFVKGDDDAPIKIIEFGDFQCPACGAFFASLEQLDKKRSDSIQLAFRHYPLTSIHPNAFSAHRAAEAAGQQDKFIEMHDLIYSRQEQWVSLSGGVAEHFEGYATELSLDIDKYREDVASEETSATVNAGVDSGTELNITSTPTLIVNGERYEGNVNTLQGVQELVDGELAKLGIDLDGNPVEAEASPEPEDN